ncbi:DUF1097 domain-containing protein [Lentilactobacillus senioris]|uniref:DUF1097 domain-containing protein n=1 Tax=Lentilactobacillus senioris TaxID=931534 RepID=UPI003D27DFBF
MKIPKVVWIDAIGVGLFTTVYCLIMSGFNLWMGSAAFIAVSYFFGAGFPKDKTSNILLSFALGILWGLLAHWLLLNAWLAQVWPSAIMFGILTFIVLFLQGTILPFTIVPAWLIAWGTTMLIISNLTIHNWLIFSLQLFASMVLGIVVIGFASDYFKRWLLNKSNNKKDNRPN